MNQSIAGIDEPSMFGLIRTHLEDSAATRSTRLVNAEYSAECFTAGHLSRELIPRKPSILLGCHICQIEHHARLVLNCIQPELMSTFYRFVHIPVPFTSLGFGTHRISFIISIFSSSIQIPDIGTRSPICRVSSAKDTSRCTICL